MGIFMSLFLLVMLRYFVASATHSLLDRHVAGQPACFALARTRLTRVQLLILRLLLSSNALSSFLHLFHGQPALPASPPPPPTSHFILCCVADPQTGPKLHIDASGTYSQMCKAEILG